MPSASANSNGELGQLLRELGWISAEQLRQALQTQGILGGRLGTCLLESDAISESLLLEALSKQSAAPAARINDLQNIPREVLAVIDRDTAVSLPAVPFRLLGSELYVAVLDPGDPSIAERIGRLARWQVHFYVANEVRLYAALQRYYGRPLSERFLQLERRLEQLELAAHRSAPVAAQLFEFSASDQSVADWSLVDEGSALQRSLPRSRQIGVAQSVQEIGDGAMEQVRAQFGRVALFRLRGGELLVWRALGIDTGHAETVILPLTELPTLTALRDPSAYHLGPIADEAELALLQQSFAGAPLRELLIVPVFVGSRMAAAIYAEPGPAGVDAVDVPRVRNVAAQISVGLRNLVLRQQRGRVPLTPSSGSG